MKNLLAIRLICFVFALLVSLAITNAAEIRPQIYRLDQLEEAKKRAVIEDKPIAWIGTPARFLVPYKNLNGKGAHAATSCAIRALQNDTILIFSDAETQNHQEPSIVDQALHSPNAHYIIPGVIILTPSLDKVITKTFYKSEFSERAKDFTEIVKKIRDKKSWQAPQPSK